RGLYHARCVEHYKNGIEAAAPRAWSDGSGGLGKERLGHARQRFRQIFRDETRSNRQGGFAMEPDCGRGSLERGHSLGEQPGCHAGQNVAGSSGREVGRRVRGDRGLAVGGCDDGVASLEDYGCANKGRRKARPFEFRSDLSSFVQGTKISSEFSLMRREERGLFAAFANGLGEPLRLLGKACYGVRVEHDGTLACKRRQYKLAGCLSDAHPWADRHRVQPRVLEKL